MAAVADSTQPSAVHTAVRSGTLYSHVPSRRPLNLKVTAVGQHGRKSRRSSAHCGEDHSVSQAEKRLVSAHTLGGVGKKDLSVWRLHVLPAFLGWVGTLSQATSQNCGLYTASSWPAGPRDGEKRN